MKKMDKAMLDFYSNVILSSFSQLTATGASALTDGVMSHDRVTRFLNSAPLSSRDLWYRVKPLVRSIQSAEGVLIVDDTIAHKPHMDENDIVCWHYDHTEGRTVKGINLLSVLYHSQDVTLPVGYVIVTKTETVIDADTGKEKRVSLITKNEHFRRLVRYCVKNMPFRYVLSDMWYASAENMKFIKQELEHDFIMPLKSNRNVALSVQDKRRGKYVAVETLSFKDSATMTVYLEEVPFPLLLLRQVFTNKDGTTGTLYLVTSDTTLTYAAMLDLYQRRWKIEQYHKALKQQCALTRSPARTVVTQSTHIFCSLCAFVKLEMLTMTTSVSYEGLKLNLYIHALKTAFKHLRSLQPFQWASKPVFA
jgi:hypothetical protein